MSKVSAKGNTLDRDHSIPVSFIANEKMKMLDGLVSRSMVNVLFFSSFLSKKRHFYQNQFGSRMSTDLFEIGILLRFI